MRSAHEAKTVQHFFDLRITMFYFDRTVRNRRQRYQREPRIGESHGSRGPWAEKANRRVDLCPLDHNPDDVANVLSLGFIEHGLISRPNLDQFLGFDHWVDFFTN